MTALVEAALAYAARGWAVVPVRSNKHFYTTDGVGIATRDPRIIRGWYWAESVGMACGAPSGTDVLDVDDPEAFPLDLDALMLSTQAATTPSGGVHLFFKHAGLRTRPFGWGEWRSTGLAVVLPPGSGREWINGKEPGPVPAELAETNRREESKPIASFFPGSPVANRRELPKPLYFEVLRLMPHASGHNQRRVRGALNTIVHERQGRNNALNRAAWYFRHLVSDGVISPPDAWHLLQLAAAMCGYTEKDGIARVRATIASGLGCSESQGSQGRI
jgi:Bifunctional DNA primase/polymerase, N-terminal